MARVQHRLWVLSAVTSAAALVLSTPVQAESKRDRARQAIAVAEAKIRAAEAVGANTATPNELAHAGEALANARAELRSGDKDRAIFDANHAAALAEASTGDTQRRKEALASNAVENARSEAVEARQQAAEANEQAQSVADAARQQAAEANARAANAEQSAALSAQQAQAAQDAAAEAAATGAGTATPEVRTTVTTEDHTTTAAPAHRKVTRHVVRHHGATHSQTTTTVVQTH